MKKDKLSITNMYDYVQSGADANGNWDVNVVS